MDYYSAQVRREEANALRSRLTAFVAQHEQQLFETQQHLCHPTDATYWSRQHDVVMVQLGDTVTHVASNARGDNDHYHQLRQRRQLQQTSMADLLGASMMSADPLLFRFSVTLAALNAEMQALADEGRRCFAPALALVGDENENCYQQRAAAAAAKARKRGCDGTSAFASTLAFPRSGRQPSNSTTGRGAATLRSSGTNVYHPTSPEEEEALKEEKLLRQTGNLLSLFQDIWLWRQRVQEVCATLICQFACIYDDQSGSDSSSSSKERDASPLRAVRLSSCWDSLAELLGAVVLVDELLQQNCSLHEGIEVMQRVLAQQAMEAAQDSDEDELLCLLLLRVQESLLHHTILAAVVRQPFDRLLRAAAERGEKKTTAAPGRGTAASRAPAALLPAISPPPFRENRGLCAEWGAILTSRFNDFEAALTSGRGAEEKLAFAGICGLSFFFHALFTIPPTTNTDSSSSNSNNRGATAAPSLVAVTAVANTASAKLQAFTKQVISWQSALPLLPLHGLFALCPLLWWQRNFPSEVAAVVVGKPGIGACIQESIVVACQSTDAQFATKVVQWSAQVDRWAAVEMQTASPLDAPLCRQFVQRMVLLIQQGMLLARAIQSGLTDLLFLHHHAEQPLATSRVRGVLRGVLLLERITEAYHNKMGILASAQEALVQSIAYALEKHLYNLYTCMCADDAAVSPVASSHNQLVALQCAVHLLHRPLTTDTLVCLALMLDVALNREQLHAKALSPTAAEQERIEVFIALVQLRNIVNYQQTLPTITHASFLYFFREALYPLFFQYCYENTLAASALPCVVAALMESRALVMSARHVESPAETLLADYAAFLRDCLDYEVVRPLCAEIENQLRLRTHNVVLGQPYRVLQPCTEPAGRDLTRFTLLPPFRLFHVWVHLATQVEHYLSTQFYNLNALTPNDWRTYEEMRNLALRTYHLTIADGHLPGCILDQGLDVLVITENIHQFIAYYTYNLNEQLFIQRPALTSSKHLHTLNTRHIANSIRTHGAGVMNTAVNYVYKCLLKKMAVLSHFLQDNYVRSHLLKEAHVVRQRIKEHQAIKYPTEQADQLIREMDRLGAAADGSSFLGKVRQLIGEMGNALGFMRMMRSGGLRAVSEGSRFVPLPPPSNTVSTSGASATAAAAVHFSDYVMSLDAGNARRRCSPPPGSDTNKETDIEEDSRDVSDAEGSDEHGSAQQSLRRSTADAVANLDHVACSMLEQLSEGSEYFPLLLDAIGRRLRRSPPERYAHFHLLYLLVPALANLHAAYAIQEKEKLLNKHSNEGVFSDDGFAVGATFLLVLFGIYEEFDSLHWFTIKKQEYRQTLESVHAALSSATARGSSDFDNLHLTSSMLLTNLREYTSLENAFTCSKLFFTTKTASLTKEEKEQRSRRSRSPTEFKEEGDKGEDDDGDEE